MSLPGISVNYNDATGRASTQSVPIYLYGNARTPDWWLSQARGFLGDDDQGFNLDVNASVTCENCYLYYKHTLSVGLEFCAWGHFSFGIFGAISIQVPSIFTGCLQMDAEDDFESWKDYSGFGSLYANYHLWMFARYVANFGVGATLKVGVNVTGLAAATFVYEKGPVGSKSSSVAPTPSRTPSKKSSPSPSNSKGRKDPVPVDELYNNVLDVYINPKTSYQKAKAAYQLAQKYKNIFEKLRKPLPKKKKVRHLFSTSYAH